MLPFELVYSPRYDLNLGRHVFPAQKYRLIHDRLLEEQFADPGDFVEPEPIADESLCLVHNPAWVEKLRTGHLTLNELMRMEIPYSEKTMQALWLCAGGSLLAARQALERGVGINIGGGFHHAFPAHGEGFCALHDFAAAIRQLQHEGRIRTAMTIDLDVHHGNGTAAIFAGDASVFTMSMHQLNNYPQEKPASDLDIHLADNTGDAEYLDRLSNALSECFRRMTPDLVFYVAGADPYMEDQLGGLLLTLKGLRRRDQMVFQAARQRGIPVAVVLAGGYAFRTEDTVTIHANTVKEAAAALGPA
jgi:acetoin utilization deacetylase AcuC-like enzyme